MGAKRKRSLGGIFEPMLVREPLFIRLCTAFVDNLGLILRTALVIGALMLVQEFRTFDYLSPWEGTDYVLPGDEKAK